MQKIVPAIKSKYENRVHRFNLSNEEAVTLATIVESTNLNEVHKQILDKTTWLKALGLVLNHTEHSQEATKILTLELSKQLSNLMDEKLSIDTLTWQYLEKVNLNIKNT